MTRQPHHLVLFGAVSNSGDFLIRRTAVRLLKRLRPDRRLVTRDRRRPLDPADPEVSGASAIILGGGPAWQPGVYPRIYPLTDPLEQLRAPIVPLALGWRAPAGGRPQDFHFRDEARPLLDRIEADGLTGTCRDLATLDVLQRAGLTNQVMGGCTSWYHFPSFGELIRVYPQVRSLAFSVGALMTKDEAYAAQAEAVMQAVAARYPQASHTAVFHHPLKGASNISAARTEAQVAFARRMAAQGWEVVDVSGEADAMMTLYEAADLHVGYRVHAHLLRCSLRRPSVLIAEDTRAEAATEALGHAHLPAVDTATGGALPGDQLAAAMIARLDAEENSAWAGLSEVPTRIESTFRATAAAVAALP